VITIGSFNISEICLCLRERKSRDGRTALPERGEIAEDGGPAGSEIEDSPRSEDLGMQGSDLRSMNYLNESLMFHETFRPFVD